MARDCLSEVPIAIRKRQSSVDTAQFSQPRGQFPHRLGGKRTFAECCFTPVIAWNMHSTRGVHSNHPPRGSILHAETRSFRRARMRNPARQPPRGCRAQRGVASVEPPRTGALATMARLPPPKLRRHENALCETSGPAPHGPGLRPTGRGVTSLRRRPEQLYRPRHEGRGIGLSWGRESPAVNRFAQQGRAEAPTQQVARTRA